MRAIEIYKDPKLAREKLKKFISSGDIDLLVDDICFLMKEREELRDLAERTIEAYKKLYMEHNHIPEGSFVSWRF